MKGIQLILLFSVSYVCHVASRYPGSDIKTTISEFCQSVSNPLTCDSLQKFRTFNGACNNLKNPFFGAANTRLVRELRARYADGVFAIPKSVSGADLPSARLISLRVFDDLDASDKKLTIATMQFGQFVAHDLAGSVGSPVFSGQCCSDGRNVSFDPKCYNIPIPQNDPVHPKEECLEFIRDFPHTETGCIQPCGEVDQLNRVTSFLDLSVIYGNNERELTQIRSFVDGKLRTDTINGQAFPPQDPFGGCFQNPDEPCFLSGDSRLNSVPQLAIFHILFLREHNRIADALKILNPTWNDETLFQEARRICIAEYQYIVYYEWLPVLLGLVNIQKEGIFFQSSGSAYSSDYNENIDPSVINEFTAGAFRFFHTQIVGKINNVAENRNTISTFKLAELSFKPAFLTGVENFTSHCRGMTFQPAASMDRSYDAEIRSFFLRNDKPVGSDLKAIDIQRDRDHGLPTYNEMRKFAGLKTARKWSDYSDFISNENIERLKSVYSNFEDVDLSVGGALEKPRDSTVGHGPTYHYLLTKQFYITRAGDRYWFEFKTSAGAFTPQQLTEIRKSRLSRIICDNGGGISSMQDNVFLIPSKTSIKKCSSLQSVNLSFWKMSKV